MKNEAILAGSLNKYGFSQADYVWSINGICPTILAHLQGYTGHQINILEDSREQDSLLFPSTQGPVEAKENDCVSLTYGMSLISPQHSPVMKNYAKSITTLCDHDIGIVVRDNYEV